MSRFKILRAIFPPKYQYDNSVRPYSNRCIIVTFLPSIKPPVSPVLCTQDDDSVQVLCRICEEAIPSAQLDEHTKYCASIQKLDNMQSTTDARLKKLDDALKSRFEQHMASMPVCLRSTLSTRASCLPPLFPSVPYFLALPVSVISGSGSLTTMWRATWWC